MGFRVHMGATGIVLCSPSVIQHGQLRELAVQVEEEIRHFLDL